MRRGERRRDADGRGESIWDRFAANPGKIGDGSRPDVTCDHYHRWRQDIEIMSWLGTTAYRFSASWSRVMPDGRMLNAPGLDFYDRLVDPEPVAQVIARVVVPGNTARVDLGARGLADDGDTRTRSRVEDRTWTEREVLRAMRACADLRE